MIGGWVARRKAMGRMFARVNSKCPTAFVPALSSNCAPAFNVTPVRIQKREIGFIERSVPEMGSLLWFFHWRRCVLRRCGGCGRGHRRGLRHHPPAPAARVHLLL